MLALLTRVASRWKVQKNRLHFASAQSRVHSQRLQRLVLRERERSQGPALSEENNHYILQCLRDGMYI